MTDRPPPDVMTLDVTGLCDLPAELLARLEEACTLGRDVELLNPSQELQELLREVEIDSILIRGSTAPNS